MTDSSVFSIRLTSEERQLADRYAKLHAMTTAEAFKKALFEKIEDEYDFTVGEQAYNEYLDAGKKSRPINELWKKLNG